ncbi:MAG: glycosyltransferase [Chloroflexi bacterium]|nr:glycosyltransferase [Chloroflexota bacterium]
MTPSLNQAQFIRATIESVLSQDYSYIEYLVIDGGSQDGTLEILRSYGGRFTWISEPDNGQAQAVNKGWKLARGEILGWVNADDLLAPNAVSRAVERLQDHSRIDGVYGNCDFIDQTGKKIGEYGVRAYDYPALFLGSEDYIPQPSVFVRKEAVEYAGFLNEEFHYVMDYDLWLRLGMIYTFEYEPKIMTALRIHQQAKTGRALSGFAKELIMMVNQLLFHPRLPESVRMNKIRALSNAYLYAASYCFWAGETSQALHHLAECWKQTPFPKRRAFWLILSFSLFGKLGWRMAENIHGNPFRLERPFWKRSRTY